MPDNESPDQPSQDAKPPPPETAAPAAEPTTAARLQALDERAMGLRKMAVAVYLGCLLVLSLLVLKTPLGTWWRDFSDATFVSFFGGLDIAPASRQPYMNVTYVAVLAGLLYLITREVFRRIARQIAVSHPLNEQLRGLDEEPRALVSHGIVSRHSRGWVKLGATADTILPAPGGWWRGFFLAFGLTAFLRPALPQPSGPSWGLTDGVMTLEEASDRARAVTLNERGLPGYSAILAGNISRGVELLEEAARSGREQAYAVLGLLNNHGSGMPKDPKEAERYWREGVEEDDPASSYFLALEIASRDDPEPDDKRYAFELASKAATVDHLQRERAEILVGYMHINGFGTTVDTNASRQVLQQAYERNSLRAARNLAITEDRLGNTARAVEVTTAAAEAGFPILQLWLARRYRNGDGVPKDDQRAFYWGLRSARQGNASAQLMVGQFYHGGNGVGKNLNEAVNWFRRASEQGSSLAMEWLGFVLRSARPVEAYVWYNLAVAGGQSSAADRRDQVANRLTRQQITAAQSFSSSWKVTEGVEGMRVLGNGTGFWVSPYHDVATNEHVVGECPRVAVEADGKRWDDVTIVGADTENDLALLRVNLEDGERLVHPVSRFAPQTSELGEELVVYGYPLSTDLLASSGVLNFGSLSANVGIKNDTTRIQISVPVQPGNSGGAVLDQSGRVVGVVQAVLNPIKRGEKTILPQNVNFAIKGSVLREMMRQFGRDAFEASPEPDHQEGTVLGRIARSLSVRILCYGYKPLGS